MRFLSGLFRFRRDSSVVYISCVRLSSSGVWLWVFVL